MSFATLEGLKRRAKKLGRDMDISHTEALERVAREAGYIDYRDARRCLGER